jgi:hypothetical protein
MGSVIDSRSLVTTVAAALLVPVLGAAQREVDPAFAVVSVKPNVTVNPTAAIQLPPAGVNAVNVTPYLLIRYAFGLPDSQIVDVPEWARRTRFDVSAKAPATALDEDMRPMVRTLLRDRFKLVPRRETRPAQVHALIRDVDRPLGPRLTRTEETCAQAPSLATALREQLGLRWTTESAPVEVLVIVQITQPDPD